MVNENKRTDILSRSSYPKGELFRIVIVNRLAIFDPTFKMAGRGLYLHKDKDSVLALQKKGLLEKHYKANVPEDFYQTLLEAL